MSPDAARGHSSENGMVGRVIPNAPSQTHRAFVNVASTLHVVQEKYCDISSLDRHVSEDAPSWAYSFFMYSKQACRRASLECIG